MSDDVKTHEDQTLPDFASGIADADLREGEMVFGRVDGQKVLLARVDGEAFAVSATCTHLGGPLAKGVLAGSEVRCPWHHARFAVTTGEAVGAPALQPLKCFSVTEHDGRIIVAGERPPAPTHRAGSPPERIMILGSGAAGFACAEMLVRSGFGSHVTVLSADADRPYDRTFCSKAYLAGKAKRGDCMLMRADFFDTKDGPQLIRAQAVGIDTKAHEVTTDDGERHKFDALVIATGAEPKRPDLPGFDSPDVHVLRTLADADALIAAANDGDRAAVVGAGFIGLEVAASLTGRGVEVTVVAPDKVPLARVLSPEIGRMVRQVHEQNGVHFRLGRSAKRFRDGQLVLDDDSTLDADFLVVGVGVAPRVELARAADLALASDDAGGGIIVNGRLETSVKGIFAAGDVASYPDPHSGGRRIRVEHWVHAQRQGQHVARVLMGAADTYRDLPFFWSAHFEVKLRYLGHTAKIEHVDVNGDIAAQDFTAWLRGANGDEAFVSCNRDQRALEEEIHREATAEA